MKYTVVKECKSCIWFEDCQRQCVCHQPCFYFDAVDEDTIEYQWNEMDYNTDKDGEDITDTEAMIQWYRDTTER